MAKITRPMTSRQCEIAAESYAACLLAQSGYDVLVQYGANQPHYDLMAVKGENRKLPISVKGSQDGGWMLAVKYLKPGVNYLAAIDKWLSVQRNDVVYLFVSFLQVALCDAPRVFIARPKEIASHLRLQSSGKGRAVLREDTPTFYPTSRETDKIPDEWRYSTERIDNI
jgi:hypothetical protein